MIGTTDFSALAIEDSPAVGIKSELVQAPWYRVCFDPYSRDGPGVEYICCRDQHPQGGMGGEDNPMVAV